MSAHDPWAVVVDLLAVASGAVEHEQPDRERGARWMGRGCYLHCPACRAIKTAKDWLAANPEPAKEGES